MGSRNGTTKETGGNGASIQAQEATLVVSSTTFGQETHKQEKIKIRPFATQPASIGVSLSRTINMGNYESVKVSISLTVPCYVEEIKRVYNDVVDFVEGKLAEKVKEVEDAII